MKQWITMLASAIILLAPTGFPNEVHAQSTTPEQTCLKYVMGGSFPWNQQGASQWHQPNAQVLCAGTPMSDYPTDCFKAAIKIGLNWQQGIQQCQYNFNSCVYQAMTQKGMRVSSDAKVAHGNGNFAHEVYQCHYGQPHPGAKEVKNQVLQTASYCSRAEIENNIPKLNQTERTNLCGQWEASKKYSGEPVACYNRVTKAQLKSLPHDLKKNLGLQLCNKTVNSGQTIECYNEGKAAGYDDQTIVNVCGITDQHYNAFFDQIVQNHRFYGVVVGMPDTCIRRNAITNQGGLDLEGAWAKCKGQPLW